MNVSEGSSLSSTAKPNASSYQKSVSGITQLTLYPIILLKQQ